MNLLKKQPQWDPHLQKNQNRSESKKFLLLPLPLFLLLLPLPLFLLLLLLSLLPLLLSLTLSLSLFVMFHSPPSPPDMPDRQSVEQLPTPTKEETRMLKLWNVGKYVRTHIQ